MGQSAHGFPLPSTANKKGYLMSGFSTLLGYALRVGLLWALLYFTAPKRWISSGQALAIALVTFLLEILAIRFLPMLIGPSLPLLFLLMFVVQIIIALALAFGFYRRKGKPALRWYQSVLITFGVYIAFTVLTTGLMSWILSL